jgi:hypothetical protein
MPGRGGSRRCAGIKPHKGLRPERGPASDGGSLRIEKGSARLSDTKAGRGQRTCASSAGSSLRSRMETPHTKPSASHST